MSKKVISHTAFSCDICQAENITPVEELFRKTCGFSGIGGTAVGIKILAVPFGDYREHICITCANTALRCAMDALNAKEPQS